jgi:general secretion pathway protein E
MPFTEQIRGLIGRQASSMNLFEAARAEGMRTLREAAVEKVLQGVTTVSEIVRVTGGA